MTIAGPSCLCGSYGQVEDRGELLDEATDLPACDYDENPTELYKSMEQHQWGAVSRFLKTGVWPGNFFSDKKTPKQQVRTWIHKYEYLRQNELRDEDASTFHSLLLHNNTHPNKLNMDQSTSSSSPPPPKQTVDALGRYLKWRQLPLHAALIFLAPPVIVKQLIEAFPYALRCPDDKGMLPLHLAFRQAVPDDVLTILLRLFPNGMHVRDSKGRLPVECVRVDLIHQEAGSPPLRGMIIQSIMQQSKDKFTKQQADTIQTFRASMEQLHAKMTAMEQQLVVMDQREKTTRQELSSTLDQLSALKKNHRTLQEMQQLALQRQSDVQALDQKQHNFQQRLLEQLELADPQSRSRSRSRGGSISRGRVRSSSRDRHRLSSRPGTPTSRETRVSPPTVRREDPRGYTVPQRSMAQSDSITNVLSHDFGSGTREDEGETDTPSYSSGISRYTDLTKGVIPNEYTTAANAAFAGKTAHNIRDGPAVFRNLSYATKATNASGTTFHTQAQMAAADNEDSESNTVNTFPLHEQYQSFLDRRHRPKARSIYPISTPPSASNRTKKSHKGGVAAEAVVGQNSHAPPATGVGCGATESPASLNWDFSFTPGFLRPLSINEL